MTRLTQADIDAILLVIEEKCGAAVANALRGYILSLRARIDEDLPEDE